MHDVLEVNAAGLRVFFTKWVGKKARLEDFLKLLVAEVPGNGPFGWVLDITEQDIVVSFANSKFIVLDEMEDLDQLLFLKFDEFLEFVVRLAVASGLPGALAEKAYKVVDLMFKLPGDYEPMTAARPEQQGLGDTESDYD